MLHTTLLFVLGLILICTGSNRLVDTASSLSRQFGISPLVIGATVVSICTTLPEILVSSTAIVSGSADICLGNAAGSIVCNTGLIAGISLLVRPSGAVSFYEMLEQSVFFFAVSLLLLLCGRLRGSYGPPVGVSLLLLFVAYTLLSLFLSLHFSREESVDKRPEDEPILRTLCVQILTLAVCAAFLFAGSRLLVSSGIVLAERLGIPERVIAVTAIALGTSLPELITAILSLIRRSSEIGLGNVIGANLLNLLLVIGLPAAFTRIPVDPAILSVDFPFALVMMLVLTVPTLIRRRRSRLQGAGLLFLYLIYCLSVL